MKTILIAETSPMITAALVDALSDRYEVHTCADGSTTLECLEQLRPDALIINLALPDLDGLTVLARTAYAPPVILALTSFVSNEVIQQAAVLGVNYTSVIPCSIKAVVARLEEMIGLLPI